MSKRWALRLLLAVMLLAAFSAAVSADEGDGWYDASQEEYFWQDQQEVVFPDVTPEHWSYDDVMYLYRNGIYNYLYRRYKQLLTQDRKSVV